MDAMGISSATPQKKPRGIASALVFAVLEWLLLSMLFVDAIFAFIITKYARYHKLQTPCLLCSRLDHVLGREKRGYYWDLICGNHKLEISSLVICHAHNKLVDVHQICESCLSSFASISKSNAEKCRLLEGKLPEDNDSCCDESALLEGCKTSSSGMSCSCCSKPVISGGHSEQLIQAKSIVFEATELHIPSSDSAMRSMDSDIKQMKNDLSVSHVDNPLVSSGLDPSSCVGYSELKVASDPHSEVVSHDNEEATDNPKDFQVQHVELEPLVVTLAEESSSEKLIDQASVIEPSMSESHEEPVDSSSERLINQASVIEPTLSEPHEEPVDSSSERLINQAYVIEPTLSEPHEEPVDSSSEKLIDQPSVIEPSMSEPHEEPVESSSEKLIDQPSVIESSMSEPHEEPVESSSEKLIDQPSVIEPSMSEPHEEPVDSSSEKLIDQPSVIEPSMSEPHEQPVDSRGAVPAESTVSSDSGLEDFNLLPVEGKNEPSTLPELISFDVAPPSSNGTVPSVEMSDETLNVTTREIDQTSVLGSEKACEPESVGVTRTSTGSGPQLSNLMDLGDAYKAALENKGRQLTDVLADSSKASTDFKRLLSQLSAARGLDQSFYDMSPRLPYNDEIKPMDASNLFGMHILQKRASLERNESNLSMDGSIISIVSEVDGESMVERLRRQIEYDRKSMSGLYRELEEERNASAIAANQAMAMITKLQEEKASLNMEASQYLRMMEEQSEYDTETLQNLNDLLAEKEKQIQDLEEELEFYKRKYPNELKPENTRENSQVSRYGTENEVTGDESMAGVAKSLLEFEDESSYILHSLKKLENKLLLFSDNGNEELKEVNSEGGVCESSGGSQNHEESSLPSAVDLNKENDDLVCDLANIRKEVYDLNGRLRALEADRSFLEHAIYSLRNGHEGLQFIQEIASHLREIRKIGTDTRDQSLA